MVVSCFQVGHRAPSLSGELRKRRLAGPLTPSPNILPRYPRLGHPESRSAGRGLQSFCHFLIISAVRPCKSDKLRHATTPVQRRSSRVASTDDLT